MGKAEAVKKPVARAGRVVRGLARPSTRTAYVEAIRERVTAEQRKRSERCLVCGARGVGRRAVASRRNPERRFTFRICHKCGHVANPDNVHDYRNFTSEKALPLRARVGTAEHKGREFHMAQMAVEILGRNKLDVLVYGAGRSHDNHHIEALDEVRSAAVGDIMKVRDDAEFVDLGEPAKQRFDIVVACEVVEHFVEPRADFAHLLSFVERDGLVVCSTNLYDGGSLSRHPYVFIPGHVSYYSPEALQVLAKANGFHLDIRMPWVATGYGGPRKRYLLLSRSPAVMEAAVAYFGRHQYAPSEPPDAEEVRGAELTQQRSQELAELRGKRRSAGVC